ncbi:hypothetical protein BDR06DRAFT_964238 [Suillus hirtellus]|nr:hypothetical protein BDR06DRAFT_964238 [Suillus hirtellus]
MRLSLLAVVVASAASMFVSACNEQFGLCETNLDCCDPWICWYRGDDFTTKLCVAGLAE